MPKLFVMSVLCAIAAAFAFLPISSRRSVLAQPEPELVRLDHEIFIAAAPDDVWAALTTPEGLSKWIASEVNVSIALDGPYELFFRPENERDRGMEGTRVLSFLPGEMLSYTGEVEGSWVVWRLTREEDGTRVRVAALGTGDEWAERAPYFDEAMPGVLERLAGGLSD